MLKKYGFDASDTYMLNKQVQRQYKAFQNKAASDSSAANLPREVDNLANRFPKPAPPRSAGEAVTDTGLSLMQSAVALPRAAVGLYDLTVNTPINAVLRAVGSDRRLSAAKALSDIGYRPEETQQILQGLKSEQLQQGNQKIDSAKGFTDTAKAYWANPANAVDEAVQSTFPSLAGGAAGRVAAASVLAKNPLAIAAAEKSALTAGALSEGAQSGGDQAYQQSVKQGETGSH